MDGGGGAGVVLGVGVGVVDGVDGVADGVSDGVVGAGTLATATEGNRPATATATPAAIHLPRGGWGMR